MAFMAYQNKILITTIIINETKLNILNIFITKYNVVFSK
jgi:hypothetical protein